MDSSDNIGASNKNQGINALTKLKQWILWKKVKRSDGRIDKIPIDFRSLKPADAHDSSIWLSYKDATKIPGVDGYGFVFTKNDPFFFIDIDNCLTPDGKNWLPIVGEVYARVPNAAIGISQSGRGLHIMGTGTAPTDRRCKAGKLFDLYTEGRFVAISGRGFTGDASIDQTAGLTQIVDRWLRPEASSGAPVEWTTDPAPGWKSLTDAEILSKARSARTARAVFGDAVTFEQLWTADGDALGSRWPDDSGTRAYDYSAADSALAQHLAFWTGKNCEHVRGLMFESSLNRDKWRDRPEYLERTILAAVGRQKGIYTGGKQPVTVGAELREGFQYQSISEQVEHFKDCVYIGAMHSALVPSGEIFKPDRFRAHYGGYIFAWDNTSDGKTTRNAWDVFTESQGYNFPKVDNVCFRPRNKPWAILTIDGETCINTYRPLFGDRIDAPVDIFLDHIHRLLPVESDREILLSYMAACVQLAGTKFQWAPVIQGVDGNGKSLLYLILEYTLGKRYCHQIDPTDLNNVFNGWIEQKLLFCIEEIHIAGNKVVTDKLKPLITNNRVAIQAKGRDQQTGDNCANFILNSNHRDAVEKTAADRRYAIFYTAQQEVEDLVRDGMDSAYFTRLYAWLRNGGYGAVANYLHTRPITVDVMGRAPRTSSTDEAMIESLGNAEQRLQVAIDTGEPGFLNGIIDFSAADRLLRNTYRTMSPKAISVALKKIGYIKHPAERFRINGIRKRLYVEKDSAIIEITDNDKLTEIYLSTIPL